MEVKFSRKDSPAVIEGLGRHIYYCRCFIFCYLMVEIVGSCGLVCHLLSQMSEHYWTPQSNVSNETSTGKTFQRTISAQVRVVF